MISMAMRLEDHRSSLISFVKSGPSQAREKKQESTWDKIYSM